MKTAEQLIAGLGYENFITREDVGEVSTDELLRCLEILKQPDTPDTTPRELEQNKLANQIITEELAARQVHVG